MAKQIEIHEGNCTCGQVHYRMTSNPLIVHCCHCTWCQRQTGTAFAVNALIEANRVEVTQGKIENTIVETLGGSGQRIARCPKCKIAVWSEYLDVMDGKPDVIYFVRVGTLDSPEILPPDVHIYTSTKQPWFALLSGALAFDEFYDTVETWPPNSLKRLDALVKSVSERGS